MSLKEDALKYHAGDRPGKIEVISTKPCQTQRDLSLAYTPGVAEPCWAIEKDPETAYEYTARGNLVAVVSNGTAVLGLGDIGALAGKPVMEGKGVLFKRFAGIDVFDIELDTHDPDAIIQAVKLMEPTFGGINLEDIKAPECFYIEERLKEMMNIPVFHDDQHGTAIISGAGLLNALEVTGKDIRDIRVVFNGAGAAGVACAKFYIALGVRPENMLLCDSKGVIHKGRTEGMNPYKEALAADTDARTLADAMRGADVFAGLSAANVVTPEMVRTMAANPVIFAMANPDPEISYADAKGARPDVIIATGRSDYPNQINNVLGFPFIFRGALDVRASRINEPMKIAAAKALAELARQPVPYQVIKAYGLEGLSFGRDYLIPKPFDPRVLLWETAAVAEAAMMSGVARRPVVLDVYREQLEARLGFSRKVTRILINKARRTPKRIVFPEGDHPAILKACEIILSEGMADPILLASPEHVARTAEGLGIVLPAGMLIIDPRHTDRHDHYEQAFHQLRQRHGVTPQLAHELMVMRNYFGAMMVRLGDADGLVSGLTTSYADTLRPMCEVIGPKPGLSNVAGMHMISIGGQICFFGDAAVHVDPTAEELAGIALLCAGAARHFGVEPRVAMVSFSSFGSSQAPEAAKVRRAVDLIRARDPELVVDGEVQADTALNPAAMREHFAFSPLRDGANVLVFPCLSSCDASARLLQRFGGADVSGPILLGMNQPVQILQFAHADEQDVVKMTAIAACMEAAG